MKCIKCKIDFVSGEEDLGDDFCPVCKEKNKAIALKIDAIMEEKRKNRKERAKVPGFDYQKARANAGKGKINYMNI